MSTPEGNAFAGDNSDKYSEFLNDWDKKLNDVTELTDGIQQAWSTDIGDALGTSLQAALTAQGISDLAKLGFILNSQEELVGMWVKTAIKAALIAGSFDLLRRFFFSKNNEGKTKAQQTPEFLARSPQTLAQIYDMVDDRFQQIAARHFKKTGDLTGRRRWVTVGGKESRHSTLNGQVRNEDAKFNFKGDKVIGPRPKDGNPNHWSGCSCYTEYETSRGSWVRL